MLRKTWPMLILLLSACGDPGSHAPAVDNQGNAISNSSQVVLTEGPLWAPGQVNDSLSIVKAELAQQGPQRIDFTSVPAGRAIYDPIRDMTSLSVYGMVDWISPGGITHHQYYYVLWEQRGNLSDHPNDIGDWQRAGVELYDQTNGH